MQAWWQQLSQREQWLVGGCSIIVLIIVVINFIWLPLYDATNTLREDVISRQRALTLMEETQQKLTALRQRGLDVTLSPEEPLLTTVESTFSQKKLSQYISSVQQKDTSTVSLTLTAVPFDDVMDCVELLWDHYTVQVTKMQAQPTATKGLANMSLEFKR